MSATGPRLALALGLAGLSAACTFYEPTIRDCMVQCSKDGACPADTTCEDGSCRTRGSTGKCVCLPGSSRPCGGGLGACLPGVQTCSLAGTWDQLCLGETKPTAELCDGKDNDCDGVVDDDPVDLLPCGSDAGVCAGKKRSCDAGVQPACTAAEFGPKYEPLERSCDELDNDCDGLVDQGPLRHFSDVLDGYFSFVGYDGGFAFVFRTASGLTADNDLFIARSDRDLSFDGGAVLLRTGKFPFLATAAIGSDVYIAYGSPPEVGIFRVTNEGDLVGFEAPRDAGFVDQLRFGVGDHAVAFFRAELGETARAIRWNLDGGLDRVVDLNRGDAGWLTTTLMELNLSTDGRYSSYTGVSPPDAGLYYWSFITHDLETLAPRSTDGWYGGPRSKLIVQPSGRLTGTYTYAPTSSSSVVVIPDVLNSQLAELVLESSSDPGAWGPSDAVMDEGGDLQIVYLDKLNNRLVLGRTLGSGISMSLALPKVLPSSFGVGIPGVAISPGQAMLGVGFWGGNGLDARLVCGVK